MKKIMVAVLALVMAFGFTSCKKKENDKSAIQEEIDPGQKAAQENAEILSELEPKPEEADMPSVSLDTVEEYAKKNGAKSVTVKKDGSLEVDMTDEDFNAMMEKLGKAIIDKLETVRKSSDMIESVQTGLEFDKYYIFVDKAKYDAAPDAIDISECCESAEVYQLLNGKRTKDVKLTLYIMNKDDDIEIARKVYTVGSK